MNEIIFVYMTTGTPEDAQRIGAALVEQRLAACVNWWSGMTSLYRWEGAVQSDQEVVLVAKTTQDRYTALEAAVRELHPYDCPCIVAWPVPMGHAPFRDWLREQTHSG